MTTTATDKLLNGRAEYAAGLVLLRALALALATQRPVTESLAARIEVCAAYLLDLTEDWLDKPDYVAQVEAVAAELRAAAPEAYAGAVAVSWLDTPRSSLQALHDEVVVVAANYLNASREVKAQGVHPAVRLDAEADAKLIAAMRSGEGASMGLRLEVLDGGREFYVYAAGQAVVELVRNVGAMLKRHTPPVQLVPA